MHSIMVRSRVELHGGSNAPETCATAEPLAETAASGALPTATMELSLDRDIARVSSLCSDPERDEISVRICTEEGLVEGTVRPDDLVCARTLQALEKEGIEVSPLAEKLVEFGGELVQVSTPIHACR